MFQNLKNRSGLSPERQHGNKVFIGKSVAVILCPAPNGKLFGVLVDKESLPTLQGYFWRVRLDGKRVYAVGSRTLKMHRVLLPNPRQIDHINQRGTDNRRSNIRAVSSRQNALNRPGHSKTGFKGVVRTSSGRFAARVYDGPKPILLGTYDTAEQAARVVDAKAKEIHGEFAFLNFPGVNL